MIVILIYFSSIKTAQSNQDTQAISHTPSSPQFIDFIYNKPINGISVSGRFTIYRNDYHPIIETYYGLYMGTASLTLTRLSDMRSTTQEFRDVSFLSSDTCQNDDTALECIIENPLFLKPDQSEGFLPDFGLKIVDYDFDNKDELILITSLGYRGEPEFIIYDITNNNREFTIDYGSELVIPGNVEFDIEKKLMTYNYSSGACLSDFYYFKAEGLDGYKRFKVVNYDQKEINGKWICRKTVYIDKNE